MGYFFYLGFGLGDSKKLGPDNNHDSLIWNMIPKYGMYAKYHTVYITFLLMDY